MSMWSRGDNNESPVSVPGYCPCADHVGRVVTFNSTDSRISSVVDFDGAVTTLAYNAAGRLTSVTEPDPDAAGPLASPVTTYGEKQEKDRHNRGSYCGSARLFPPENAGLVGSPWSG